MLFNTLILRCLKTECLMDFFFSVVFIKLYCSRVKMTMSTFTYIGNFEAVNFPHVSTYTF